MDNRNNQEKDGLLSLTGLEGTAHTRANSRQMELLRQITCYIDGNLAKKITLRSVADRFGISISTVTQLFQRVAGITFHSYLTQRRMSAAGQLIRSGTPLEEIGRQVGYNDHSSFYRAFKQTFGVSPREYKKQLNRA